MYLIFIKKKDILGEGKRIIMKLYVVISDDYDEGYGSQECDADAGSARTYLPKWERANLSLWKALQRYVPPLNAGLTILWKSVSMQNNKVERGIIIWLFTINHTAITRLCH